MSVQELHHKLNIMVKQDKERGELQAGDQRQALETIIDKSVEFGDKNEDVSNVTALISPPNCWID